MVESFLDRRREPRRAVSGGVQSDRAVAISVRLLDIGLGGVLVASSLPLDVGQWARLSARFGDRAIDADVEVRRVSAVRDDKGGYKIGARFVSLDEATRQAMQQFFLDSRR
jgi:c-di-GMP-binding flagellar brake protein YcgR